MIVTAFLQTVALNPAKLKEDLRVKEFLQSAKNAWMVKEKELKIVMTPIPNKETDAMNASLNKDFSVQILLLFVSLFVGTV